MRKVGARVLAAVLLLLVAGCAYDVMGRRSDLEDAQKRYTRLVRWSEFAKASEFVAPEALESFLAQTRELEHVRFTDWELTRFDLSEDRASATVVVTYGAYRVPSMAETRVVETQRWTRDPESGEWRVTPGLESVRGALVRAQP